MKNIGTYKNDLSIPRKKDVDAKQDKITASGFLVGDGAGGVSAQESIEASAIEVPNGLLKGVDGSIAAAVAGTDYVAPDDIPSDIFVATYGTTTLNEILTALNAGKAAICIYKSGVSPTVLTFKTRYAKASGVADSHASVTFVSGNLWVECDDTNTWTNGTGNFVLNTRTINGKALSSDITLGAVYTATLTASGWTTSGEWKTQTVTVSGLKATYNAAPFVDVSLTGTDATGDAELSAAWMGISATAVVDTGANSITVKFPASVESPTVNIPIRITVYD